VNRQDLITRTLMLEQVAAEARARAAKLREELAADARAELAEQGTAPTWRIPDIGTVTLPVSKETVYVSDEQALLEWVKAQPGDPTDVIETVERLKPWYVHDLLTLVEGIAEDVVIEPDTGESIPGLRMRPGGVPGSLSFRPSRDAQAVARAAAEKLVGDIELALGGPVVLAEPRDA
jgi:hypothetical protein